MLPIPAFWPGEFHGLYSPCGHKKSDTTEQLSLLLIFRTERLTCLQLSGFQQRSPPVSPAPALHSLSPRRKVMALLTHGLA